MKRLDSVLEGTPVIVYVCAPAPPYTVNYITANVERETGYPAACFLDDPTFWVERLHPEDRDEVLARVAVLMEAGRHLQEYRFRVADDTYRWVEDAVSVVRDPDGRPIELVGSLRLIDERKAAEEALSRKVVFEQAVADIASRFVGDFDLEGALRSSMGMVCCATGATRAGVHLLDAEQTRVERTYEWCSPEAEPTADVMGSLRTAVFPWWMDRMREGRPLRVPDVHLMPAEAAAEKQVMCALGVRSFVTVPLFVRGGLAGFIGFTDVPASEHEIGLLEIVGRLIASALERRRVEDERQALVASLRASEARYRTLVEHLPQRIFLKNRDSVFVSCNENLARDLGTTVEEVIGRTDHDFLPADLADKYVADDRRLMASGEAEEIEEEYLQDGERRWIRTMKTAVRDEAGEVIGVLGVFWDVTAKKLADDRLREALQAADAANRAKGVFLATISHEIRTPMNAILGHSQRLEGDAALSAEQRGHVDRIRRSGEQLLSLIEDVLQMSRIEAGLVTLRPEPFDLSALVDDVEAMMRPRAEERGLELVVARDEGRGVGDVGKLRQVLLNLVGNAIKFTEAGRVVVRATLVGTRLRLEVEDTGPGIPPEDRERVFEAFQQTEVGRAREGGTGLGLTISRQFARLMGGDLVVESAERRGSRFVMEVEVEDVGSRRGHEPPSCREPASADREVSVSSLPPDLVERLRDAVTRARLDAVMEAVLEAERVAPEVGVRLRRMAEGFEYERLLGALAGGRQKPV